MLRLKMQRQRSIQNGNTRNSPSSFAFIRLRRTWSFHVVVFQDGKEIYNGSSQLLFCSLKFWLVTFSLYVVVVVCLNSLLLHVNRYSLCSSRKLPRLRTSAESTTHSDEPKNCPRMRLDLSGFKRQRPMRNMQSVN